MNGQLSGQRTGHGTVPSSCTCIAAASEPIPALSLALVLSRPLSPSLSLSLGIEWRGGTAGDDSIAKSGALGRAGWDGIGRDGREDGGSVWQDWAREEEKSN